MMSGAGVLIANTDANVDGTLLKQFFLFFDYYTIHLINDNNPGTKLYHRYNDTLNNIIRCPP